MADKFKYSTITAPVTAIFKDRGSRFLAFAYPVIREDSIKTYIRELKKAHPKAVHHCVAWRLGTDGTRFRANDDGEPSGSAGKPMLGQIDSAGLTNVLVVVVRYFGGTLLGVPGLIQAYKTVTATALQQATVAEKWIETPLRISFNYPVMNEVLYLLRQAEATLFKQDMQLFCLIEAGIPLIHLDTFLQKLSLIRDVKTTEL